MGQKRSFTVPIVVALVLLLLPSLYVGVYYAMVDYEATISLGRVEWTPTYSLGGDTAKVVFSPVHWIDRKVRPDYWEGWQFDLRNAVPMPLPSRSSDGVVDGQS